MDTRVTEIAPSVHRICTFDPEYGIQFNQFLVVDDEPFLIAVMHGASYRGDGEKALGALRGAVREFYGA